MPSPPRRPTTRRFRSPGTAAHLENLGWFLACLCTPLLGEDLAERLPRYRPDSLLARETNGDLALLLPCWRTRVAEAGGDDALRALVRGCSRRLVRTGFTLVMPRWNGWTSDLHQMAQAFGASYPGRAARMRAAAVAGYEPGADAGVPRTHLDDLGPWLAEEYARVHGIKASRPGDHPWRGPVEGLLARQHTDRQRM